ncbi:DUF58 domain-containing protein [Thiomicrorhabdus xiamenensis]|uniref:DUF58 domain-containing protein n=1 Tax=Thiomicrorhabdus xiamenensis TaxID=2739063 RepID=A0A7D4TCT0_9GAMM|nr:DUF58 domain-containing protein [Thiomicrorhabdus xiamenensis]QKI88167.1 DUF58 domain-containing protein [Thiomicrorhabdus xiamenensis]
MKPLDSQSFKALLNQLDAWNMQPDWGQKLSSQSLQGPQNSRMHGSGSEFAESRPYAHGDEIRHLDWRLMARSGEAFSRRFEEQRQAEWVIAVDMREPMWFGTRRQFKVSQALNLVAMIAWQAQRHNVSLQLWAFGDRLLRIPLTQLSGQSLVLSCLQSLNHSKSEWLAAGQRPVSLSKAMNELFTHTDAGASVFIVSDLHDFTENAEFAKQLIAWRQRLTLNFLWLYDPAEVALPAVPGLQLLGSMGKALRLDRLLERKAYQHWAQSHYARIEEALIKNGARFAAASSETPLQQLARVYLQLTAHNQGVLAAQQSTLSERGTTNG